MRKPGKKEARKIIMRKAGKQEDHFLLSKMRAFFVRYSDRCKKND
jgi:hypothetical protein